MLYNGLYTEGYTDHLTHHLPYALLAPPRSRHKGVALGHTGAYSSRVGQRIVWIRKTADPVSPARLRTGETGAPRALTAESALAWC